MRYGIPMTDIPLTTGSTHDRGANAYQYTGLTIYDPLIAWELDGRDRPGKMIPGLATEVEGGRGRRRTLWTFKLRSGVKFHDGSAFDADAVYLEPSSSKVFNKDAPQFDTRQSAQVRPRLPGLASYRKSGDMEIEIKTKDGRLRSSLSAPVVPGSRARRSGEGRQGLDQVRHGAPRVPARSS